MSPAAARPDQVEIRMRIVIENPVPGVLHSLQEDDAPLDPKRSASGEALSFDFPVRVGPGSRFFGKQVRPEGKLRRFVYIRIGTLAGDCASEWTRRMKIDIHDIDPKLLDRAMQGGVLAGAINGTLPDGSPACATIKPVVWRVS
jgi:hypothetical protein